MSLTGVLLIVSVICGLVWFVLHIVMIVHGFKTSAGWGLIALFVPLGSLAFAFAKSGRKGLAAIFLASFLGAAGCGGVASYLTAKAIAEAAGAGEQGMHEFDKQIQDLENLDDIKL